MHAAEQLEPALVGPSRAMALLELEQRGPARTRPWL